MKETFKMIAFGLIIVGALLSLYARIKSKKMQANLLESKEKLLNACKGYIDVNDKQLLSQLDDKLSYLIFCLDELFQNKYIMLDFKTYIDSPEFRECWEAIKLNLESESSLHRNKLKYMTIDDIKEIDNALLN